MSYEPLHHKYRPQTFAELVGQEAIATTLTNAISSRRIAPAYLFAGPRGTGKTSSARILAKSLNCIAGDRPTPDPCGQCDVCLSITRGNALDVVEIDAASNTGVDNIREVIERAQFAPAQCRYKVYVVDECHMLSTPAFNALLKTLEEPPPRVVFVLATTDPQKVLTTIISRCQRFDFRRIPLGAMAAHLQKIASIENINIASEAITLVAQIANGGLRDAESLLDQLSLLAGTVTVERVWDLVGAVPERDLMTLLGAIAADNPEAVIEQCRHLMDRGREPLIVLQNLASFYLNLLIAKTAPQRQDLVAVTEPTWQQLCQEATRWPTAHILQGQQHLKNSEVQLKNSTQPRLWLEVTILGLLPAALTVQPSPPQPTNGKVPSPPPPKPTPTQAAPPHHSPSQPQRDRPPTPPPNLPAPAPTPAPTAPATTPTSTTDVFQTRILQTWERVLETLPPLSQALVREHCDLLSFDLESSVAEVGVRNQNLFKIAQSKKGDIEAALTKVWQQKVTVNFQVSGKGQNSAPSPAQPPPRSPEVSHVSPSPPPPVSSSPIPPREVRQQAVMSVPEQRPTPATSSPEVKGDRADPSPVTEVVEVADPSPLSQKSAIADEAVNSAVQSFVEQFSGEIVALEGDFFAREQPPVESSPPPDRGLPPLEPSKPEVDEEIPF